jgi:hypothetical protein
MKNVTNRAMEAHEGGLLYFTSDQLSFLDKESALKHAKRLDDKSVITMTIAETESQLDAITSSSALNEIDALLDELTGTPLL